MFCGCVWLGYARILAPQGCASLTLGCVLAPRGCASLTPGCVLAPIQGARCSDDRKPGVALRLPRAVFWRPGVALRLPRAVFWRPFRALHSPSPFMERGGRQAGGEVKGELLVFWPYRFLTLSFAPLRIGSEAFILLSLRMESTDTPYFLAIFEMESPLATV